MAIVATGTSSQQSLLLWLRKFEQHNPRLRSVPIVVTQNNPDQEQSSNENDFQRDFDYKLQWKKQQQAQSSASDDNNNKFNDQK